jgi:hypothetical protein
MPHAAIIQIQRRVESAKHDSDFTYFYSLLLEGEALLKTTVLGFIGSIVSDPDQHRYGLERSILKAEGLNPWALALDNALSGPASQFLLTDLSQEKSELTKLCGSGTWQFEAVTALEPVMHFADFGLEFALGPSARIPDATTCSRSIP